MDSVVFFGKGGIGKSTLAANVSALLAARGGRVLHVGCDPKRDSTLSLMGRRIPPFCSAHGEGRGSGLAASVFASPVKGVDCIEAGGPQAGVGCAGAGIGSMLDAMRDEDLLRAGGYGAAVFDVLGDVVCGGFAAPLRRGFARKAVVVTSGETLSLYAANNLLRMINSYSRNGPYLAGIAINLKDPAGLERAQAFAAAVNARVLGVTLPDPAVHEAEKERRPAALARPDSDFAARARRLAAAIAKAAPPASQPRPMSDEDFASFIAGKAPAAGQAAPERAARTGHKAARLLEQAGFSFAGIEDGSLACVWHSPAGPARVIFEPAAASRERLCRFSDWSVSLPRDGGGEHAKETVAALRAAAARLAALPFRALLAEFACGEDFYAAAAALCGPGDSTLAAPHISPCPDVGMGRWDRFIFQTGDKFSWAAPGSRMLDHGDMECRFSGGAGGAMGLFSARPGSPAAPGLPISAPGAASTDFTMADAVFGDGEKLRRSLRAAAAAAGRGGLLDLGRGCSPILLATDARGIARQVGLETGVCISVEDHNSFYDGSPERAAAHSAYMVSRLKRRAKKPAFDVNLVNFGAAAAPLAALLRSRGIKAAEPGDDFYHCAAAARLQLLPGTDPVIGPAFDKAGYKWLAAPAPYAFKATRLWLKAVGAPLGKKNSAVPAPAQRRAAAALARAAAGYAAAFIADEKQARRLARDAGMPAATALRAAAEAGFALRLLLRAEPAAAALAAAGLKKALPGARLTCKVFSSQPQLRALLAGDKALRLVYSDIRGDLRAAAAGKAPFSSRLLEPGYDGALETARRLLELSKLDFNERYPL
jgi:nitrogenase iron protein NifH